MLRGSLLTFVLGVGTLLAACYSTGADDDGSSAGSSSGATSGGRGGSGGSNSGGSGGATRGGATGDPPLGGAGGEPGSAGNSSAGSSVGGSGGTAGSCVTERRALQDLVMAGAGGQTDFTICDFYVPSDVDDNYINVYIAGTKLCWLASSQGCDMNPYGFWFNGGRILLCDVACSAYFDPEPDLAVTLEIGCALDSDCQ
jgi:hypothetical protein